jgi:DNA-binding CsgD family transcriptional regulator
VVERDGRQLNIRLVHDNGHVLLLLTERSTRVDLTPFIALGLTSREAEVLSWLAQGKTDGEIGTIIGSRPKTVGKHLERIYKKLGVESRTAAVARAFEAAN